MALWSNPPFCVGNNGGHFDAARVNAIDKMTHIYVVVLVRI